MNHDTCTMKSVTSVQAVRDGKPGSFFIEDATESGETFQRLWAQLPDGTVDGFALAPAPAHIPGIWQWNGSKKKPTLYRSTNGKKQHIWLHGRWCGQIKAGRMVSDPAPATGEIPVEHPLPPPPPNREVVRKSVGRGMR